jgi:spore coat protein U-like protein
MRNSTFLAVALAAFVALPGGTAAQSNTADLTATAQVLAPIDVSFVSDLDFGDVLPGVPMTVAPADGGQFTVTGATSEDVILDFTLPSDLTGGGDPIPVSFTAGWGDDAPDASIDPTSDPTVNLGTTTNIDVFLGGTVTPAINQAAGTYNATVTLTVTYPTT